MQHATTAAARYKSSRYFFMLPIIQYIIGIGSIYVGNEVGWLVKCRNSGY